MARGVHFIKPDFNKGLSERVFRTISPGERLVRLGSDKYPGNAYNPKTVTHRPNIRGRFSGTPADPFGTLYAADYTTDESVVILEKLKHRDLVPNQHAYHYVQPEDVEDLSFYYLTVTHAMLVVKLTTEAHVEGFGANWPSLFSENYWYSREWTRYIRHRVKDAKGFEYVSVRHHDARDGAALVLFSDRVPEHCVVVDSDPVRVTSRPGRDIFLRCQETTKLVPNW